MPMKSTPLALDERLVAQRRRDFDVVERRSCRRHVPKQFIEQPPPNLVLEREVVLAALHPSRCRPFFEMPEVGVAVHFDGRLPGIFGVPGRVLGGRKCRERPGKRRFEVASMSLKVGLEVVRGMRPDVGAIETEIFRRAIEADVDTDDRIAFKDLRNRLVEFCCSSRVRR